MNSNQIIMLQEYEINNFILYSFILTILFAFFCIIYINYYTLSLLVLDMHFE